MRLAAAGDYPEWEEDIRRLADLSSEFASLWTRQEVAGPAERVRQFRHPDVGVLTFTSTELEISAAPELRIVVNTPRDESTWAGLPQTRRSRDRPAPPRAGRCPPGSAPRAPRGYD